MLVFEGKTRHLWKHTKELQHANLCSMSVFKKSSSGTQRFSKVKEKPVNQMCVRVCVCCRCAYLCAAVFVFCFSHQLLSSLLTSHVFHQAFPLHGCVFVLAGVFSLHTGVLCSRTTRSHLKPGSRETKPFRPNPNITMLTNKEVFLRKTILTGHLHPISHAHKKRQVSCNIFFIWANIPSVSVTCECEKSCCIINPNYEFYWTNTGMF